MFLIIFGVGEKPVIVILAVTVFFFVWIQTMASVMSVPEGYREAAVSFGVTRRQMFRHVILPAALPQIFVGLRIAAGVAVLTVIGVEFVFAPGFAGLGYRINNARTDLRAQAGLRRHRHLRDHRRDLHLDCETHRTGTLTLGARGQRHRRPIGRTAQRGTSP